MIFPGNDIGRWGTNGFRDMIQYAIRFEGRVRDFQICCVQPCTRWPKRAENVLPLCAIQAP